MARKVGIVKKLTKTLKHMTKPKNLKKVLLLLGVLLALYMIRKHVLKGVEGFESSVGDFDKDVSEVTKVGYVLRRLVPSLQNLETKMGKGCI